MVGYLVVLLAYAAFNLGSLSYFWKGTLVAFLYVSFDLFWTYFRDYVWYVPLSSIISGSILALVAVPGPPFGFIFLLPLLAVASKQLIKIGWQSGPSRHIFNPAAFSMMGLSLAGYPAVSWWSVAWGSYVFYLVLAAGLFILWRQNRWETAAAFFLPYLLVFKSSAFDGTVIFFATVMLIEPMTSNFLGKSRKIAYGAAVSLIAIFVSMFGNFLPYDPLLLGLLLGNLIFSLKMT